MIKKRLIGMTCYGIGEFKEQPVKKEGKRARKDRLLAKMCLSCEYDNCKKGYCDKMHNFNGS